MARSSQAEHIRFRYGICLNEQCSKCKSKKVQEISIRKDLICEECQKPLRECPPPKRSNKMVLMGGAAVVIAAAVTGYFLMGSPEKKTVQPDSQKEVPEVTVNTDTLKKDTEDIQMETPQKAQPEKPKPVLNGHGTVDLGYGIYTGDLKNGKPHRHGTIKYTQSHKIVNSQDFIANPGDKFEGDFRDGRISSMGYWYHDGNQTVVKP